jgi:hypothetical protein
LTCAGNKRVELSSTAPFRRDDQWHYDQGHFTMTQRKRTLGMVLVAAAIVAGFITANRYFETAGAKALFGERFENALHFLETDGQEVLDWDLVRAIQGRDGFPAELAALEGEEITVIGFVTPHDTGLLLVYGGRHSNYDNPLTYGHVVELDLSPLPKNALFFGNLLETERVRVRTRDPHGTEVHAEYPQLYRGRLVLDPDAEHGVVVQLAEAEHLTAPK